MKPDHLQVFEKYIDILLEWNKKFNLTSVTDKKSAFNRHILDSLTLLDTYDFDAGMPHVIDIGSGAGFPGIPLKIMRQNIHMTLVDSVAKKIKFLNHIIEELDLKDISAVWSTAEDYAKANRQRYCVAVCRALAPLNVACELCLPLIKRQGVLLAMKGKNVDLEISQAQDAIVQLGGKIDGVKKVFVPGEDGQDLERNIVTVSKVKDTPLSFPRKPGFARKRPL